tara:strand:+ start:674 stop:964 length:291 start_codon:yes stop_codon:yes gene_type:complete
MQKMSFRKAIMHQNELNKKRIERDMKDNKVRMIRVPVEIKFICSKDMSNNPKEVEKHVSDLIQTGLEYNVKPFVSESPLEFIELSVKIHTSFKYFD